MNFFIAVGVVLAVLAFVELARTLVAKVGALDVERFAGVAIRVTGRRRWHALGLAIGPLATYLAIAAIAFVAYCGEGFPDERIFIERVGAEYDAAGKLALDDQVIAVDGRRVFSARDIGEIVAPKRGGAVTVTVIRDGAQRDLAVVPLEKPAGTWRLGITLQRGTTTDAGRSVTWAARYPKDMVIGILGGLVELVTGTEAADIGGPARIVEELRWIQPTWTNIAWISALLASYLLITLIIIDSTRLVLLLVRGRHVA
jgi:hypothetical protein